MFAKLKGARKPAALAPIAEPAELPAGAEHVWRWFGELAQGLAANGFAAPVVTWEGLQAWRNQMRVELDPWEARALVQLGQLRAAVLAEDQPKPGAK